MKKLLSIIFIGTIAFGCKNADTKDAIEWPDTLPKYEVIFLMPQDGKANEFEEQIKAHDSKFHNKEGGPTTSLRFITTGMNAGYYAWAEGPMQYAYVDEKGEIDGHQEDWDLNISPLVKDMLSTNYYSLLTPISYTNETLNYDANILEVVGFKVADVPDAGKEVRKMLHRWKNAFEAGNSTQEFRVFSPMLTDTFETKIDARLIKAYKRIRGSVKNGLAIVPIERGASGGSYFTIPPQVQMEIAARQKIITDEYSGRILVDAELAEEEYIKINKMIKAL